MRRAHWGHHITETHPELVLSLNFHTVFTFQMVEDPITSAGIAHNTEVTEKINLNPYL